MKSVYVEIWKEAADLRVNGKKDDRLAPLDKMLKEFEANIALSDRTGSGNDTHFLISLPDEVIEADFLLQALNTPEILVANCLDSNGISLEEKPETSASVHDFYHGKLGAKYAFWNAGIAMPPSQTYPKIPDFPPAAKTHRTLPIDHNSRFSLT